MGSGRGTVVSAGAASGDCCPVGAALAALASDAAYPFPPSDGIHVARHLGGAPSGWASIMRAVDWAAP